MGIERIIMNIKIFLLINNMIAPPFIDSIQISIPAGDTQPVANEY
jgi:hypothetical protein